MSDGKIKKIIKKPNGLTQRSLGGLGNLLPKKPVSSTSTDNDPKKDNSSTLKK